MTLIRASRSSSDEGFIAPIRGRLSSVSGELPISTNDIKTRLLYDDPTGKRRSVDEQDKRNITCLLLAIGIVAGFIVTQVAYMSGLILKPALPPEIPQQWQADDGLTTQGLQGAANEPGVPLPLIAESEMTELQLRLREYLKQIAPSGEVLVSISNNNLFCCSKQLPLYLEAVQRLNFTNWLVVAIDDKLHSALQMHNVSTFYIPTTVTEAQKDTGMNHAVSALKYGILRNFLAVGWHVFLSDVDVVMLQNPFDHLYRDYDLEGMTDGFDNPTAYGFIDGLDDPSMGWSRYAQGTKHLAFNSGMFYVRANERTIDFMGRLEKRLLQESVWDQQAFNEELFFLPHGDYKPAGVSARVMDFYRFMNSKVLFRTVRYQPPETRIPPVAIHLNYHPDKQERMEGVVKHFIHGDVAALDPFPGGSEPGS